MSKRSKVGKNSSGLGRTLMKNQNHKKGFRKNETGELISVHSTDEPPSQESILTQNDFDSLMEYAEMSGKQFEVVKERAIIVTNQAFQTQEMDPQRIEEMEKHWNDLKIPKRPEWNRQMSKEELVAREKETFLEWRRSLIELEKNDHLCLTPFEKNLEVWRQLWRVVEKSQLVVQIVDARNPLFFRSIDLEDWVNSFPGKKNLLLVNKSDLLSESQRKYWANYFAKENIEYLFFSATVETERNQERESQSRMIPKSKSSESSEESSESEKAETKAEEAKDDQNEVVKDDQKEVSKEEQKVNQESELQLKEEKKESRSSDSDEDSSDIAFSKRSSIELVGADELVKILMRLCQEQIEKNEADENFPEELSLCNNIIGMVGYPNVGKSSTINAIVGCKKVQVSHTPGKTKHFQTIVLPNTPLTLCDCPGLVFPSFLSTKNEMYCNGLLRIAEIREVYGPVSLVCRKIPRAVLDHIYGISLPKPREGEDPNRPPTPIELLDRHAYIRGYMNRHGQPDHHRAARLILNDYAAGKLLYSAPPPSVSEKEYNPLSLRYKQAGLSFDDIKRKEEERDAEVQSDAPSTNETPEDDFEIELDVASGTVTPHTEDEDAYMNRIKPNGRKVQKRKKLNERHEQQAGAFTTGQRIKSYKKTNKPPGPTTMLPTSVRVSASGGQRTVTVLGVSTTPGTMPATNHG